MYIKIDETLFYLTMVNFGKLYYLFNMDMHVLQIPKTMVSIGNSGTYINYGKNYTIPKIMELS